MRPFPFATAFVAAPSRRLLVRARVRRRAAPRKARATLPGQFRAWHARIPVALSPIVHGKHDRDTESANQGLGWLAIMHGAHVRSTNDTKA